MPEEDRSELEKRVDEQEERAEEARRRAGEAAETQHVEGDGGEAPEQEPEAEPPARK